VENGKFAKMSVTWDNTAALAQLGHMPARPGKNEVRGFSDRPHRKSLGAAAEALDDIVRTISA